MFIIINTLSISALPLCEAEAERLVTENSVLRKDVDNLRRQLNQAEIQNGCECNICNFL